MDWREIEQLALDLDIDEIEVDENAPSFAEIQARSESARKLLEDGSHWKGPLKEAPTWLEHYFKFREMGFTWRVATYISWASSPKKGRWPETQADLAEKVLGLNSPRQITEWRKKDPRIDDAITMLQAADMQEHRADVIRAHIAVASDPDYKATAERKLYFEMSGDYIPRGRIDVGKALDNDEIKNLSDAELRSRAGDEFEEAPDSSPKQDDEE